MHILLGFSAMFALTLSACGAQPVAKQMVVTRAVASASDQAAAYDWRTELHWVQVPESPWGGSNQGSTYLTDVMNHTTDRFESAEPPTNGHESMHGLLNQMNNLTGDSDQFVYWKEGKGAYVMEPLLHASHIKEYLPEGARQITQSRHDLYLVEQVAAYFPNVLYQFDEWNAYVTGATVATEIFRAGQWNDGGTDAVDGAMDFVYFASAAALALQENEPNYIATNDQFKAAYAMLAERSIEMVNAGVTMEPFSGFHAAELKQHFVSSPENQRIRTMLSRWLGARWTQRVFGF